MRIATLKKLWRAWLKKGRRGDTGAQPQAAAPLVDPLSVGIRVDLTVPAGRGKEMAATKLIWISPVGSVSRSGRRIKTLLIPN